MSDAVLPLGVENRRSRVAMYIFCVAKYQDSIWSGCQHFSIDRMARTSLTDIRAKQIGKGSVENRCMLAERIQAEEPIKT